MTAYKGPKEKEAKQFMKFLLREDNYVEFLHSFQPMMYPVLKDITTSEAFLSGEVLKEQADTVQLLLKGLAAGHAPGMEHGPHPLAGIATSGVVEEMFHRIIVDNVPVEQAVADAGKRMEEMAEEWRATLGL
jgi:ABC-type glycerol-3-phosphate transport system substrate-binding protein